MTATTDDRPVVTDLALHLDAVRRALLDDARVDGERIVADARADAQAAIASANRDADAEVERERRRSELAATAHADVVLARTRNNSRAEVLRQQAQLRQRLVTGVRARFLETRTDQRYPALLDRLESIARRQLGDDATIERDPTPGGGLIAVDGGRRVDYRLTVLADRALAELSDEVEQLWA